MADQRFRFMFSGLEDGKVHRTCPVFVMQEYGKHRMTFRRYSVVNTGYCWTRLLVVLDSKLLWSNIVITITLDGQELEVVKGFYPDSKRTSISLTQNGMPWGRLTVNLPEAEHRILDDPANIMIKNYSENESWWKEVADQIGEFHAMMAATRGLTVPIYRLKEALL